MTRVNLKNLSFRTPYSRPSAFAKLLQLSCDNKLCPLWFVNLLLRTFKPRSCWRQVPLIWLDELEGHKKHTLRNGSSITSHAPHFLKEKPTKTLKKSPNLHYHEIKNGRVSAISSSVLLEDLSIVVERVHGVNTAKGNYSTGQVVFHGTKRAIVILGTYKKLETGIFFGGNGSFNYYHWIVEILSKAELLNNLPAEYDDFPILVHKDVWIIPSFQQTFEIFFAKRKAVLLDPKRFYRVDSLVLIDSPNNLPFNLFGNPKHESFYTQINGRSIGFVRNQVLNNISLERNGDYPDKLYFCRRADRRGYNQIEVHKLLQEYGFVPVYFEELSFTEQVKTIHNATYFVGPTGAVWTNLIFAKQGSKGLCWMAEEIGDFSAFSTIAKYVSVDLRYITYQANVSTTTQLFGKDYQLNLELISAGLEELGLSL